MIQKEKFIVDVLAEDEEQAKQFAHSKFDKGDYQETGDLDVESGTIYDVTNTDDPFNP